VDPRPASVAKPVAPSAVEKPAEAPKPAAKHEDDKKPAKK